MSSWGFGELICIYCDKQLTHIVDVIGWILEFLNFLMTFLNVFFSGYGISMQPCCFF